MRDKSGKAPIAIVIAAAVLVCLGIGGFAILKFRKPAEGKKASHKVELKQWKFEEFLVNLADKDESRYLKVNLVLEVEGEPPTAGGGHGEGGGGGTEDIKARDAIITVLTKRSYRSLLTEEGKASLKAEVKQALNDSLEDIKVHDIYFTSFAMQ